MDEYFMKLKDSRVRCEAHKRLFYEIKPVINIENSLVPQEKTNHVQIDSYLHTSLEKLHR